MRTPRSHGSGRWSPEALSRCGQGCIFEEGVLVFHPENVEIGDRVYVGHGAMLKGYYKNRLVVGDGSWIGPGCQLHAAGGLVIGASVGIGPSVHILTSLHEDPGLDRPILEGELRFSPVEIGDGADLGVGAIVLPGVRVGRGVQVGAGAVVTRDLPDFCVAAGNPARVLRMRSGAPAPREQGP